MVRTHRVLTAGLRELLVCAAVARCGRSRPVVPALGAFSVGTCALQRPMTLRQVLWPAAKRELAPPDPVAIQLCRYSVEASRPLLRLVGSRRLTEPKAVTFFARALAALPLPHGNVVPVRQRLAGNCDPHVFSGAEPCSQRRTSGVRDRNERRGVTDGVRFRHASREGPSVS